MTITKSNTQINGSDDTHANQFEQLRLKLMNQADKVRGGFMIDAEILAQREYHLDAEELKLRICDIHQKYNPLVREVDIALNPLSQGMIGQHEAREYKERLSQLAIQLGDIKKKEQELDVKDLPRPQLLGWHDRLLMFSPYLLLGLDAFFEAPALRSFMGPIIFAFPVAMAINLIKYLWAKYLTVRIGKSERVMIKRLWVIGGFLSFGLLALLMGFLRQQYLNDQGTPSTFGPMVLGALSFILSIGAWVAEYFATPVRVKGEANQALITEREEIERLAKQRNEIEEKITAIKAQRTQTLGGRLITMDNAQSLKRMLDNHYRGTVSMFQSELRTRRTSESGHQPPPVVDSIPPLDDGQTMNGSDRIKNSQP